MALSAHYNNMKKKHKITLWIVALISLMAATVYGWEQYVRAPLNKFIEGDTIVVERLKDEPTEYELWLASQDVQSTLQVMFERHKLEQKEAELKKQQAELETAKEELRAKELDTESLQ